jgi:adenylate cyclase
MNKGLIICVDDEKVILHGLHSQLNRVFGSSYALEMCESGEEALDIIKEALENGQEILVLITDQMMPEMKGNDLLRQVYQLSPTTCNIMLTGRADSAAIGDAVNNANLYRYFNKPWEGTDLVLTVKQAILKHQQEKLIRDQLEKLEKHKASLEVAVKDRTFELEREKEKINSLLLNILPSDVAKELKAMGYSKPSQFDTVSVLFTDFKGFTKTATKISPEELVKDLNDCFMAFDEIVDRHNMEKIKTIGDSYMCAGGLPAANKSNPIDAVYAAWAIKEWTVAWNKNREDNNKVPWEIRIGIHTGEVVAGIIGKKKFQYDLWGDAVNVASRMESHGEEGEINISAITYDLVKKHFSCDYRGEMEIKNRGKIGMYFVKGII